MSSFTDKARQILSAVAPTLGTAIGGPFGALAGVVLAKVLGADPNTNAAAASVALETANPETLLAIKKQDEDFKLSMAQLGVSKEKMEFDDRANARARETATKDNTPRNLAYLVLGGTAIAFAATMLGFAKADAALVGTLIGYMIGECKSVMQYYFGSSSGSKSKDDALADIAKQP